MLVSPDEYSVVAVTKLGFLRWINEQKSDCKQRRRWRCELCFLAETWRRRTRSPCSSPAPSRSSCCAPTSRSAWRTCRGAAEGPTLNTASTTSPRVGHSTATLAACSGGGGKHTCTWGLKPVSCDRTVRLHSDQIQRETPAESRLIIGAFHDNQEARFCDFQADYIIRKSPRSQNFSSEGWSNLDKPKLTLSESCAWRRSCTLCPKSIVVEISAICKI